MKKMLLIVIIIVLLGGALYALTANDEPMLDNYVCNINEVDYYVHKGLVFLESKEGEEYIYTDFGVYQRKETRDGWILKIHPNNKNSAYTTVFKWIEAGEHPMAGKVKCKTFKTMPESLQTFVDTHQMLFKLDEENFKKIES